MFSTIDIMAIPLLFLVQAIVNSNAFWGEMIWSMFKRNSMTFYEEQNNKMNVLLFTNNDSNQTIYYFIKIEN